MLLLLLSLPAAVGVGARLLPALPVLEPKANPSAPESERGRLLSGKDGGGTALGYI
jgi:hypothetical protein